MEQSQFQPIINFIWSVADDLPSLLKPNTNTNAKPIQLRVKHPFYHTPTLL
ncbi:hypothetical protein [Campylobacter sp. VTCC 70190]|uniref:hypothetical protein n=1 Tax=Campylobacter sp. VTCC 70190 TaxID=3392118 RepID=UPI00398E49F2